MKTYKGKKIHRKIGMGPVEVFDHSVVYNTYRTYITDKVYELERLKRAMDATDRELSDIYHMAVGSVGKQDAGIFDSHRMLLQDETFLDDIKNIIVSESVCAEYAVNETGNKYVEFFNNSSNSEMKARATDIRDVCDHILANLYGKVLKLSFDKPSVILTDELTPSEVVSLDKKKTLAIVVGKGALNSHASILARSMDIPMMLVEDKEAFDTPNGTFVIADGEEGIFIVEPDAKTNDYYVDRIRLRKLEDSSLQKYASKDTVTKSSRKIGLFANASNIKEVETAVKNNASGIGLFRTEFLFLDREEEPSVEEQYKVYSQVVKKMGDKPVTFRILDIGSDKKVEYIKMPPEENPALGIRGMRLMFMHRDILKNQLKALFMTAAKGDVSIMYPMISSLEEVEKIKETVEEVSSELKASGKKFVVPKQGIMIETPAAVMISDELAKHFSFFSLGTNDLTQYALALDRQNGNLTDYFIPHHEAIIRFVKIAVENGHKEGIPVSICGEMALDDTLLETYLEMGVDSLSVAPVNILKLRKNISEH